MFFVLAVLCCGLGSVEAELALNQSFDVKAFANRLFKDAPVVDFDAIAVKDTKLGGGKALRSGRSIMGSFASILGGELAKILFKAGFDHLFHYPCKAAQCASQIGLCSYRTSYSKSVVVRVSLTKDRRLYIGQTSLNRKTKEVTIFQRDVKDSLVSYDEGQKLLVIPVNADWMDGATVTLQTGSFSAGSIAGIDTVFSVHRCRLLRNQNDVGLEFAVRKTDLKCMHSGTFFRFTGYFSVIELENGAPFRTHPFAVVLSKDKAIVKLGGENSVSVEWTFMKNSDDFELPQECAF